MTRLRVACIGTGFIAGRHLAALAGIPGVDVVAVADPRRERAEAAAERHGARAYDDGLALLAVEDLDAVWLCVPPYAHGPLEEAAVDRGLPFLVEKPLALDLESAERIDARVREAGLLTAVGYHWRHLDVVRRARELLRQSPPHLVVGAWWDRTPAAPWWSQRDRSGGQLLEQATHLFDLARVLVGEVATVTAVEAPPRPGAAVPGDVPAAAAALLGFASGAVGTLSAVRTLGHRHLAGISAVSDGMLVEVTEPALGASRLRVVSAEGDLVTSSEEDPIAAEDRELVAVLRGEAGAVTVPYAEALRTHRLTWEADRAARRDGERRG